MPLSEEQRKAASERMKAMHAKKKEAKAEAPKTVTLDEDKFNQLMDRLAKLEDSKTQTIIEQPSAAVMDQFGRPQGITQKYSIDPSHYKDPRDALYDLKELRRQALRENYHLTWNVEQLVYETKYGTSFSEPKFTLTLYQKRFDENGDEIVKIAPDGKEYFPRIIRQVGVFFEDPAAAIKIAQELGLPIDNVNSSEFLEQMRFQRYKQWLMDIFNPSRPTSTAAKRYDEVIGGNVYQVEAYSKLV